MAIECNNYLINHYSDKLIVEQLCKTWYINSIYLDHLYCIYFKLNISFLLYLSRAKHIWDYFYVLSSTTCCCRKRWRVSFHRLQYDTCVSYNINVGLCFQVNIIFTKEHIWINAFILKSACNIISSLIYDIN